MDELVPFLDAFFEAERDAWTSHFRPDRDYFHAALARYNGFSTEALHDTYGLVPDREPIEDADAHFAAHAHINFAPAKLLRVSRYAHPTYGELFLALTTIHNPNAEFFGIHNGLFIAKVDGALRIVQRWSYDSSDDKPWIRGPGDRSLKIDDSGALLEVRRFATPNWDDADTAEHLRDF